MIVWIICNYKKVLSKSMVCKIKTDPFELSHLKQMWAEWKKELQAFYLKLEFQFNNNHEKNKQNVNQQSPQLLNQSPNDGQLNEYLKFYINNNNQVYTNIFNIIFSKHLTCDICSKLLNSNIKIERNTMKWWKCGWICKKNLIIKLVEPRHI